MDAPPVAASGTTASAAIADTVGLLYRRVALHGRFDDSRAIVLPGRSLFGSPGVHIVTPLVLADGSAVLVNRGWVPSADGATVEMKMVPIDSGSVTGVVLPFPARAASISTRAPATPRPGEFRRVWYAIDEPALRAQFPYALAPVLIQMASSTGDPPFPKRLPPPPMDEGPHLSYALQWLAFAIITATGWITFVVRSRAERSGARVVTAPPHPPRI
jgi:surfeit locus 1 family protein